MNILFVNYGQAGNNTTHHMAGFALAATMAGHEVAMVAPKGSGEWPLHHGLTMPLFDYKTGSRWADMFKNGAPPGLIHAFTPREGVREFVFSLFRGGLEAALIIHLEDNEEALMERFTGKTLAELRLPENAGSRTALGAALCCPLRWQPFLALADGVSVIYPTLADFVPAAVPWRDLPPILDIQFFRPLPHDESRRAALGIAPGSAVLCYSGNDHYANRDDVRQLYTIIHTLNQTGTPTRLVRTGKTDPATIEGLAFDPGEFMISLGFVNRAELPAIMSLCDVFIQPGGDDGFNRYRLPAKVPEYLCLGKPVILGPANIASELTHGVNAWITSRGTTEEMIEACRHLLSQPELRESMGEAARSFAVQRFGLEAQGARIAGFYEETSSRARTRLGPRGLAFKTWPLPATESPALAAFQADETASLRQQLDEVKLQLKAERKTAESDRKRLAAIQSSTAWALAKPIHSIEKKLRKHK
ncbi:MAG: glycosyl transferase family 2 [Verrucomicrobiaceae bacterium]|nr:glycosyl transferase family 2 [Verrucomicrobiaceae bacterium]